MLDQPWAPFYRSLITLAQHRTLPPVRSQPGPILSQVYLDWNAIPPTVRIDCLTEIWKVRTNEQASALSHTDDGKLVVSPLKPFEGTKEEFLSELSEALGSIPSEDESERQNATKPLLDELDRYLVFSHLLESASAALSALKTPADALDAANYARNQFLGDDIDHDQRALLLAQLGAATEAASSFRAQLTEHLLNEPQVVLRSHCQTEFDHFDRDLDAELIRAEKLKRAASEPPRRRATPPRR